MPGSANTRLLSEFEQWLDLRPEGIFYLRGRATPDAQGQPYGLLRSVLGFRFQVQESDGAEVVRQKLETGIGAAFGEGENVALRAHVIGQMLGFDFSASPHVRELQQQSKPVARAWACGS